MSHRSSASSIVPNDQSNLAAKLAASRSVALLVLVLVLLITNGGAG